MKMHEIFKYVKDTTEFDKKRNHKIIKFYKGKLTYIFNINRRHIEIKHKSQAVIAAIATDGMLRIKYGERFIDANSTVFTWLGIPFEVEDVIVEKSTVTDTNGIISFFD